MNLRERICIATPIISLFIFLSIGYSIGAWKEAWMVFLLVPIMPIILFSKWYKNIFSIVVVAAYVAASCATGLWHPLWVMLLLIPIYYIIVGPYFIREKKYTFQAR